jgi:hypothetical protein
VITWALLGGAVFVSLPFVKKYFLSRQNVSTLALPDHCAFYYYYLLNKKPINHLSTIARECMCREELGDCRVIEKETMNFLCVFCLLEISKSNHC